MRKFSLVVAAAAVVVALAVSGSAWASVFADEKILIEGKILGVSGNNDQRLGYFLQVFTVAYEGRIYVCRTAPGRIACYGPNSAIQPVDQ
jgi:hypothetical protein